MIGARIQGVILIGVVGITLWIKSPVRGQEVRAVQSEVLVAFKHTPGSTTTSPEIPIEELKLKLLPLTKSQLESEASAWQLLLQAKVNEISDAEIAIKRQNRQGKEAKEAKQAVEKAQLAMAEAQAAQANATPGTPEYEEASKKVAAAQAALEKAREAVVEVVEAKENIEQDSTVQKAVESALEADSEAEDKTDRGVEAVDRSDAEDAARKIEAAAEALEQEIEAATEALEQDVETVNGVVATPGDGEKGPEEVAAQNGKLSEISQQLSDSAASTSQVKKQVVVKVTELIEQRVAIVDRFKVVLNELEKKGGETEQYQTYINAVSGVSGVKIDVTDTESLEVRIVGWFKSEEGGRRWGINIAKFVAIVLGSILISKIMSAIAKRALDQVGGTSEILRQFITRLIERGGILLGVLLALTALEVSLGPILALLGGASFVLAFALQSNLSNFASGLMIMIYKPFDIGDEIRVNGLWGFVDSITLANTKITGFSGQNVMYNIPNSTIWGSVIENMTSGDIRAGVITIRSSLKNKIRKVEQILLDIAKSHPKVLTDPPPATMPFLFEEYYISIDFAFRVKTPDFWGVWADIMYEIQDRFEQEGIIIALPQQEISIHSPGEMHKFDIQSGNKYIDRAPDSLVLEIPDPPGTSISNSKFKIQN